MVSDSLLAAREQLNTERDRLSEQLAEMSRLDFDDGFADTGQVTAERGEVEALAASLLETLRETEEALGKLDAGTYGLCENCGNGIAPARLEAMPMARLCIDCANDQR